MELPDIKLILAVIIIMIVICIGIAQILAIEPNNSELAYSRLFLEAPKSPDVSIDIIIGKLIECESSGNPAAIGKAGEIGLLQFMPTTFQAFCVDRYHLKDKIWDSSIQIKCARQMLENNLENHWSCYDPQMSK
jgi:hypothetical protein